MVNYRKESTMDNKKQWATGIIYNEDGSVREVFQHENEKDVHDMMAYVISISSKNLRSEYIGRINGKYKVAL